MSSKKRMIESGRPLITDCSLPAHTSLRGRLPYRDFQPDGRTQFPDSLSDGQDLRAKPLGVLDLEPRVVAQDDHDERWQYPVRFFDEQEIGSELESMPLARSFMGCGSPPRSV